MQSSKNASEKLTDELVRAYHEAIPIRLNDFYEAFPGTGLEYDLYILLVLVEEQW